MNHLRFESRKRCIYRQVIICYLLYVTNDGNILKCSVVLSSRTSVFLVLELQRPAASSSTKLSVEFNTPEQNVQFNASVVFAASDFYFSSFFFFLSFLLLLLAASAHTRSTAHLHRCGEIENNTRRTLDVFKIRRARFVTDWVSGNCLGENV